MAALSTSSAYRAKNTAPSTRASTTSSLEITTGRVVYLGGGCIGCEGKGREGRGGGAGARGGDVAGNEVVDDDASAEEWILAFLASIVLREAFIATKTVLDRFLGGDPRPDIDVG
jgi:hypothetical protein